MQYPEIEAYLVVFSLTDRQSFRYACEVLRLLRHHSRNDAAVVLVGNKSDLVRGRRVTDDGQFHIHRHRTRVRGRGLGGWSPSNITNLSKQFRCSCGTIITSVHTQDA